MLCFGKREKQVFFAFRDSNLHEEKYLAFGMRKRTSVAMPECFFRAPNTKSFSSCRFCVWSAKATFGHCDRCSLSHSERKVSFLIQVLNLGMRERHALLACRTQLLADLVKLSLKMLQWIRNTGHLTFSLRPRPLLKPKLL